MVGGVVIGVSHDQDGTVRVLCAERAYWNPTRWSSAGYVYIDEQSHRRCLSRLRAIMIADAFWWQGRHAYWTPYPEVDHDRTLEDIELNRITCAAFIQPQLIPIAPPDVFVERDRRV